MQGFRQRFDRKGGVRIQLAIAAGAGLVRSRDQIGGIIKFRHHAVNGRPHLLSSSTLACGSSVRTSKIEIIGSSRMKRKNRNVNSPMVPTYVAQSQRVGWKTR